MNLSLGLAEERTREKVNFVVCKEDELAFAPTLCKNH